MTFYDEIAVTARAVLAEFGQVITLRNTSAGTYDPASSETTVPTATAKKRKAAVFDFKEGTREEGGTLIQAGDKKILMEAGVEPSTEDQVVLADGTVYNIVSVRETSPAGTPVIYTLHGRPA